MNPADTDTVDTAARTGLAAADPASRAADIGSDSAGTVPEAEPAGRNPAVPAGEPADRSPAAPAGEPADTDSAAPAAGFAGTGPPPETDTA